MPLPRPVDEADSGREQIAREGERIAGSVGDAQVEARGAGGDGEAGRKRVADRTSKAPLRPLPVFSATIANVTRSPPSTFDTSLSMAPLARTSEDTVPEKPAPALPGGVKAKGATGGA